MLQDIRRHLEGWLGETEFSAVRPLDPGLLADRFPLALSANSEQAAQDAVTAAEPKGEPDLLRRHRALRAGLAWARLFEAERTASAEAADRLLASRATLPDGTPAGWSDLRQLRDRSAAREARAAAERAMESAAGAAADLRLALAKNRREEAQRRGFRDERGLFEELDGIPLAALAAEAQSFLAETSDAYRDNLDWVLRRHGSSRDTAALHDLDWARSETRQSLPSPRDRMLGVLEGALKWMGLDPAGGGKLRRSVAAAPPTVVARRRVPGEIHLLLHPEDGVPAWAAALGEWGRGLAAAWTPAGLPMEDRVLGDPAVPLAWAALLALVPLERDWLSRVLDVSKSRDAARELQALALASVRGLAGLLLAEIDLAAGSPPRDAADRVTSATLARFPAGLLLEHSTPWFRTAHRLRAAAAAASLAALLQRRFESWHRNPETGKFLLAAWALGRQSPLPALLETLGAEKNPFPSLARRFLERLS